MTVEIFDRIVEQQNRICQANREIEKKDQEIEQLKKQIETLKNTTVFKDEVLEWFDVFEKSVFVKENKKEFVIELLSNIKKNK